MPLDSTILDELATMDTPTVCNALELLVPERRGFGYTVKPLVCARPVLPPIVGYARTAVIRARDPQTGSLPEGKSVDGYYAYIAEGGPCPSIVVIQDLDEAYGSWWGEVNSNVHKGLGCLGGITDGSIRDLPDLAEGFQLLARAIGPSHAHVHVVDYGGSVTVAGMAVSHGDLIHADQHGAVVIPQSVAKDVKAAADLVAAREAVVIKATQEPGFDMGKLRQAWKGMSQIH